MKSASFFPYSTPANACSKVNEGNAFDTICAMAIRNESRTHFSGSVPGTCGSSGRLASCEEREAMFRICRLDVCSEYDTDFAGDNTGREVRILRREVVRKEATLKEDIRTGRVDCSLRDRLGFLKSTDRVNFLGVYKALKSVAPRKEGSK